MAFLTDNDFKDQVKDDILATLVNNNAALLRTNAEQKAEAQMRSRLASQYDVNAIFAASGVARNSEIIMYYIDMVLYHLHSRMNPGQVPQLRIDRYNEALTWLDKMASGEYKASLPVVDADSDGVNDNAIVKYGGMEARNPYY